MLVRNQATGCSVRSTPSAPRADARPETRNRGARLSATRGWRRGLLAIIGLLSCATAMAAPGRVEVLRAPSGSNADLSKTFVWSPVSGATWYRLHVGDGDKEFSDWYRQEDAGCNPDCSIDLSGESVVQQVVNSNRAKTWWVAAWNESGTAPWSVGRTFYRAEDGYPGVVNDGLEPLGSQLWSPTEFTWQSVPCYLLSCSDWYQLWVQSDSNTVDRWYSASDAGCANGGECDVTLNLGEIQGGDITRWWVRTWNPLGYGQWSAAFSFVCDPAA